MRRRNFIAIAAPALPSRVVIPLHRVSDRRARCAPAEWRNFWDRIWPEAVREFGHAGIDFVTTDAAGEIRRSPGDLPIFVGLRRDAVNLVLTDAIPHRWDNGKAKPGVSTIHEGYHICLVALRYAHANRIPLLAVNTCVHELLHVLLGDIFIARPGMYQGGRREFETEWRATRLWLLDDGAAVRRAAQVYLDRLRR